jgi:uncharacterized repeat protein (TIGR03833 family)
MYYDTDKYYTYEINLKDKKTRRVSRKNIEDVITRPPKKGDKVKVIIKPYNKGVTEIGIVKRVLTKKKVHTRGHKVELETGTIGRIMKIY